jgi:hypothetical protein
MHDKAENRTRATPSFKMNQIIDPVPLTPLHEKILGDHLLVIPIFEFAKQWSYLTNAIKVYESY